MTTIDDVLTGRAKWCVITGDCLDVLRTIPAGSVDAVVTDPPYGMDLQPQRGATKAIVGDTRREAKVLWWLVAKESLRVSKPNTHHLFFGRWSETWAKDVLDEWFRVKGCVVWKKNVFGLGYFLRPQWELGWYCHNGEPATPDRAESDVWECARVHEPEHSCQKPTELMMRAVKLCSGEDAVVLDPFCGSGTTGVACMQTGRRFIGIEIDEGYAAIARRRIAEAANHLFAETKA